MKGWLVSVMLLCFVSVPPRAEAFVDDPFITPAQPTPDDKISVHVNTGWCHAPTDDVNQAELIRVSPGQLQLIADGVVLPPGHPFCIHPPLTYRFDIGTLPAGAYSLQFFIRDDIGGSGLVGFGSVNFTVRAPARIPVLTPWSLAIAIALVLILSAAFFPKRDSLRSLPPSH